MQLPISGLCLSLTDLGAGGDGSILVAVPHLTGEVSEVWGTLFWPLSKVLLYWYCLTGPVRHQDAHAEEMGWAGSRSSEPGGFQLEALSLRVMRFG